MKYSSLLIYPALVIMVLFLSCGKEQDPIDILTSTSWKLVSFNSYVEPEPLWDCDMDDSYTFNTDGSVTIDRRQTCEGGDLEFEPSRWSLSENGTIITLDGYSCSVDISEDELLIVTGFFSLRFIPY